jgi:hypothetical protein
MSSLRSHQQLPLTLGRRRFVEGPALGAGFTGIGDTETLNVTNRLAKYTSIHWHGILKPNALDGVPGLTFRGRLRGDALGLNRRRSDNDHGQPQATERLLQLRDRSAR